MSRAFQTWTPRTRPLIYDSLQQDVGCQETIGTAAYSVKPFIQVCVQEHNSDSGIFSQSDLVSYATGPQITGNHLPWATRWAAWVSSFGVRTAKLPFITLPANAVGNPSPFYGNEKPSKVSIGFTAIGQLSIAIQKTESTIETKWSTDDTGLNTATVSFLGVSGVLFQTGLMSISSDENDNDLVIYYLRREEPRTIFVRFLRDNFGTEYVLNNRFQASITRLIGAEKVGSKIVLYGLDSFGRDVTFSTDDYILNSGTDRVDLGLSIVRGSYRSSAISETTDTDPLALAVSIVSGKYSDPIQEPAAPLSGDAATLAISIVSGEYSNS